MFHFQRDILDRITERLRTRFPNRITAVYVFGSRVRGDHGEWSDFDVLVVVKDRDPLIEDAIMEIFVEEELQSGVTFAPVIKDSTAFEQEKRYHTPFYENLVNEGILL